MSEAAEVPNVCWVRTNGEQGAPRVWALREGSGKRMCVNSSSHAGCQPEGLVRAWESIVSGAQEAGWMSERSCILRVRVRSSVVPAQAS